MDANAIIGPQAQLIAGQSHDARAARPEHLDPGPAAKAELLQTKHVVRMAGNAADARGLAGLQVFQRDRAVLHQTTHQWGEWTEIHSQSHLSDFNSPLPGKQGEVAVH
jgi:hypothetical protein